MEILIDCIIAYVFTELFLYLGNYRCRQRKEGGLLCISTVSRRR